MALPWLESLPGLGRRRCRRRRAGAPSPKRFAVAVHGQRHQPEPLVGQGRRRRRWSWARACEPLAPFKTKLNVINGLFNKPATGVGIHPGQTGNILSGVPLQKGADAPAAASAWTRCSPTTSARRPCSRAWCSAASSRSPATTRRTSRWPTARTSRGRAPTSPVPMEVYPSLAFDSLFENRGSQRNQSILDRVKDEAAEPQPAGQRRATRPSSTST